MNQEGDICPNCSKGKIKAIKSKFSDGYFGGCSNYPQCNYSISENFFKQKKQKKFWNEWKNSSKSLDIDLRKDKTIEIKYHTDGFVMGYKNPSPFGGGYTITDDKMVLIKQEEIRKGNFTNNEAELLGIFNTCKLAEENATIITDSKICFYWVRNGKAKARPDLSDICKKSNTFLKEKNLRLIWKPRDENKAGILNELSKPTLLKI